MVRPVDRGGKGPHAAHNLFDSFAGHKDILNQAMEMFPVQASDSCLNFESSPPDLELRPADYLFRE